MAIAFVQKLSSQLLTSGTSAQTVAFSSNPTIGNTLIATLSTFNGATETYTISDTSGNAWTTPDVTFQRSSTAGDFERASIYSVPVTATGASFKITVATVGGTSADYLLQCSEFSGVATSSALEASNTGGQGNSTTSLTVAATSITSGALLIAVMGGESNLTSNSVSDPPTVNGSTTGVNSIAVSQDFSTIEGGEHAYKILGAGAAQSVVWTYTSDGSGFTQYVGAVGIYKPTGAPILMGGMCL